MKALKVRVEGGWLIANDSYDPEYPGIDVEFVADNDKGLNMSRPRVLFEKPLGGELRALVWEDKNNEDYTTEIEFQLKEDM